MDHGRNADEEGNARFAHDTERVLRGHEIRDEDEPRSRKQREETARRVPERVEVRKDVENDLRPAVERDVMFLRGANVREQVSVGQRNGLRNSGRPRRREDHRDVGIGGRFRGTSPPREQRKASLKRRADDRNRQGFVVRPGNSRDIGNDHRERIDAIDAPRHRLDSGLEVQGNHRPAQLPAGEGKRHHRRRVG